MYKRRGAPAAEAYWCDSPVGLDNDIRDPEEMVVDGV